MSESLLPDREASPALGPCVPLAFAWMAGTVLAWQWPGAWLWVIAGLVAGAGLVLLWWRGGRALPAGGGVVRPGLGWAMVLAMAGCTAATWYTVRIERVGEHHISQYIAPERQLVSVTGQVVSEPARAPSQRGAFAHLSYEPPATFLELEIDTLHVGGRDEPSGGRVLVKLTEADHRIKQGMHVRATGWLAGFYPPMNPGEFDYRKVMLQRGVFGRLTLESRGNWQALGEAGGFGIDAWRKRIADACQRSLRLGIERPPTRPAEASTHHEAMHRRLAFLSIILLGQREPAAADLHEAFRQIGLAHLLSISGAHLAILLGLVWMIVRLLVPSPPRAALVVLVVLLLYLAAVPLRTPIVRAGLMAGLLCVAQMTGRRIRGLDLVALAALIVLLWKPDDLFTPGFQLSFGVVAALLLFARPVSQWLWPTPLVYPPEHHLRVQAMRWTVDYFAVNVVAFAVAFPVVAYHFQLISPLSVLLSMLAFPVVTLTLGLGYLKIVVGLLLPGAGKLLAPPLEWVADGSVTLAEHAAAWPGSAVELPHQPPLLWVLLSLGVVLMILAGRMRERRHEAIAASLVCVFWLIAAQAEPAHAPPPATRAAMRLNVFAVGNGSCILLRIDDPARPHRAPHTLLYDCGSRGYWNVGAAVIVPALRNLGVDRINTLVLSHADIDHYNGCLDLMDAIPVDQVLINPQLAADGQSRDAASPAGNASGTPVPVFRKSAPQTLLEGLAGRDVKVCIISRGWRATHGSATIEALWPPQQIPEDVEDNDTSIVLHIRARGRRLLLCGDIQQFAMTMLIDQHDRGEIDLSADVWELPHHGSFVAASPSFLQRVNPAIALQSSGRRPRTTDPWIETLQQYAATQRFITAERGMIEVIMAPQSPVTVRAFLDRNRK